MVRTRAADKGVIRKDGEMKKLLVSLFLLSFCIVSCSSVTYLKSELTGKAKPEGGTQQEVPATKKFSTNPSAVRKALFNVLDEQGYIYQENSSTLTIRTDPKPLTDQRSSGFFGAMYSSKLFIKLSGSSVTLRIKFDKKSNLTKGESNIEYPEKENEIRQQLFTAITEKLGK